LKTKRDSKTTKKTIKPEKKTIEGEKTGRGKGDKKRTKKKGEKDQEPSKRRGLLPHVNKQKKKRKTNFWGERK